MSCSVTPVHVKLREKTNKIQKKKKKKMLSIAPFRSGYESLIFTFHANFLPIVNWSETGGEGARALGT